MYNIPEMNIFNLFVVSDKCMKSSGLNTVTAAVVLVVVLICGIILGVILGKKFVFLLFFYYIIFAIMD